MKQTCSGRASLRISGGTNVASLGGGGTRSGQGRKSKVYGPWRSSRKLARCINLWPPVMASIEVPSNMKND